MNSISYVDVFELEHEPAGETIQVGDRVRTGPNLFPHFDVIAVSGETAWVRNINSGLDALLPINRCRKVSPSGA
ncbi:hypothetical protein [Terricaulis sp.]|uniref:hypothetical protein n=1 Tax=Terricaulis sp. TaxID=2768686 RepID=UPI002AC4672A|nr:hypothetical protein [Terricaulis sp.]MDZ4690237.1 hypothetical protein [Terricaulis sp.]